MENTKKQRFCLGAAFLLLPTVMSLLNLLVWYFEYPFFSIHDLPALAIDVATIAVTIFLFMKKRNLFLVILAGLICVLRLIQLDFYFISLQFILNFCSTFLTAVSWILLTLLILVNSKILPSLKSNTAVLCKILYFSFIVTTVISIIIFLINDYRHGLPLQSLLPWKLGYGICAFISVVFRLLSGIGLLLIGRWIMNPYVKEKKPVETASSVSSPSSEYYVSLGKHICLLLFTFGIWQMIWIYKTTRYTNQAKGEDFRNPTNKLLLYLFVPFYSIYWTYKTALRIDKMAQEKNMHSDLGTVCLILSIFVAIVPPILMQEKINQIVTTPAPTSSPSTGLSNNLTDLAKLKELLEAGVITQEEFDAKKKQLLGL